MEQKNTRIVAIDPGKCSGIAVFSNGILSSAGVLHCVSRREYTRDLFCTMDAIKPTRVVVEQPKIYPGNSKGDPNDLIKLTLLVGIAVAAGSPFCDVDLVYPYQWKGSRPKNVDVKYTESLLQDIEKMEIEKANLPKTYKHNMIDAVGIGLWALKRR